MAWIKFTEDFDFSPAARNGRVTLAYKAGTTANVTRECLEQALAAKRARRISTPNRTPDENPEP